MEMKTVACFIRKSHNLEQLLYDGIHVCHIRQTVYAKGGCMDDKYVPGLSML